MNYRFLTSVLVALIFSGGSAAEPGRDMEWPTWRGGQYGGPRKPRGAFDGIGDLRVVWRSSVGSGYSSVVVADGKVVTMASDHSKDYVVALDEQSGKELWREPIAGTYPGRDGANDGPLSTPVISGDAVFALGPLGHLVSLDLQTGKKRWSTDIAKEHSALLPHWGFSTSPLVYEDLLIVATGGTQKNMVTAFEKGSGRVVWTAGDDIVNYQSPLVMSLDGDDHLVCAGDKTLYGLRPMDGESLWEIRHRGQDFYAKIVNPVVVDEGRLFMTYRSFESKLISVEADEDGYTASDVWKSRDIKGNYNIAAYHEGYLYGYSGAFLVCIDASSGKLAWKSRPPGNGFLIGVDGHLIILTKKGALSVVKASPDAYQEVARMNVFKKRAWTPPSFSNGHIYVRCEFDEVAKVAIVRGEEGKSGEVSREVPLTLPGSEFSKFVASVARATDKKKMLDEFMGRQEKFPIIEGDRLAHIVYRGGANDVAILGDMFELQTQVSMLRVPDTDFFHASFEFDPAAILNYQLIEDLGTPVADPLNKPGSSGLGSASVIRMPAHEEPSVLTERPSVEGGRLDQVPFRSESIQVGGLTWQGGRRLRVYLPAGYDDGDERYPVIYVNNGNPALNQGKMKTVLDNTIGETVAPHIAVFVPSTSAYEYARSQRDVYAKALVKEIVPLIDDRYRTVAEPSSRAILGNHEGGFAALYVSLKFPGVFGMIAAQSAMPIGEGEELLLDLVKKMPRSKTSYYLDWGQYDQRMTATGTDVARSSLLLAQRLEKAGNKVSGGMTPNGSGYSNWRCQTHRILETFFPIRSK